MTRDHAAEQSLRDGDYAGALAWVQEQIRQDPTEPKLRIFLFQLLCLLGRWEGALAQLSVASSLDPAALDMARIYRAAVACEQARTQVFAGQRAPAVRGHDEDWTTLLVESVRLAGGGLHQAAQQLREDAFERAPASRGEVDGRRFDWIADADSRLGPILEAFIDGQYYWVPFAQMTQMVIAPPADLRDLVWASAYLQFADGAEAAALIPVRYPKSESEAEPALALARRTEWREVMPGIFHGAGQRMLATDTDELPMLDIRTIAFKPRTLGLPVAAHV